MSSEKCRIGGKAKIQTSNCTPKWYCKRRFGVLRSIHWKRIFSISNDSSKNHGYHLQTAGLRRRSSRRSISLYPSKNGRCSQNIENSKIGVSRHLDSSTTTQMAKIMVRVSTAAPRECCNPELHRHEGIAKKAQTEAEILQRLSVSWDQDKMLALDSPEQNNFSMPPADILDSKIYL